MLPKIDAPTYKTTLPDSKSVVKYRPYLVKEEKFMVIAADSDDSDVSEVINQVVSNCTFNEIDVEALSAIDMEWLLLQIRIKSKGDVVEVALQCKNEVDGKECNHTNDIPIKLSSAIVVENEERNDVISLSDTCGVKMKNMSLATQLELSEADDSVRDMLTVRESIDQLFFGDEVYTAKDVGAEAIEDWLSDLTGNQLDLLVEYIQSAPRIVVEAEFMCAACGYKEELKIAGIDSFFG